MICQNAVMLFWHGAVMGSEPSLHMSDRDVEFACGKGACKSAKNDCKGKNACKGQGWVQMLQDECKGAGGQFENS